MTRTEIRTGKIIADMKSGLGDVVIMEKYQISPSALLKIKQELSKSSTGPHESTIGVQPRTLPKAEEPPRRTMPRNHLYYRIPIRELSNPENAGTINDITNRGLQLQGITATAGEKLTLLVLADSFHVHVPFVFEAVCIWTTVSAEGDNVAGFSITKISGPDLQELRKLIAELTAAESA